MFLFVCLLGGGGVVFRGFFGFLGVFLGSGSVFEILLLVLKAFNLQG